MTITPSASGSAGSRSALPVAVVWFLLLRLLRWRLRLWL
jgi:hypothetical protein